MHLLLLPLLVLAADVRWEKAGEADGVKIYSRNREGSEVREMKATGLIDATPEEVWTLLRDYDAYTKNMPYTVEAKVLSRQNGDKITLMYQRLETPLVSSRDYIINLYDESEWKDGKGFYKVRWTAAPVETDSLVPTKQDVVRVRVVDGYWLLEPFEGGKKTYATYYVFTNPGGSIPVFIINTGNGIAVPRVFDALKAGVVNRRKAGPAGAAAR